MNKYALVNIGKDLIWESNDVKLLGVTIDRDLKFDQHVLNLCSKVNQKLSALFSNKVEGLFRTPPDNCFQS